MPAVREAGAGATSQASLDAAPALTVTLALAEVMPVLAAVMVFDPAVLRVMEKDPVPDVRDESAGRIA